MEREELKESLIKVLRLLDKGIAMERNARDFYAQSARITKSPDGKKLFEWLASFEIGHKKRLEAKAKEIMKHKALKGAEVPPLGHFDVSEASWKDTFPENPTDSDILKMAIGNEKRGYSFYQKKITFTEDALLLQMLETLASEEERHIKILTEQLKSLKENRIWLTMDEIEQFAEDVDDFGRAKKRGGGNRKHG